MMIKKMIKTGMSFSTKKKKRDSKLQRPFSWMNKKLEVKETEKYGKGVFAKENLKKDEILAILGGYIMTLEEEVALPKNIRDLGHQISDDVIIGIRNTKELQQADYFNHNCKPNAGWNGQIFLVAMRNIMIDEQVCFDYAMVLGGKKNYSMECLCGSKECRRVITNQDWKNSDLQKKYQGYFQWYLQEKINRQ